MLTLIASDRGSNKTKIKKLEAKINLKKKVEKVDSQIVLDSCLFSDSSDICIPNASDKESAIAIVKIPAKTTNLEWVTEFKPTINPRVVITPEVNPKLNPVFIACLILHFFHNFYS